MFVIEIHLLRNQIWSCKQVFHYSALPSIVITGRWTGLTKIFATKKGFQNGRQGPADDEAPTAGTERDRK